MLCQGYQNLNFSFLGQIFQYYLLGLKACQLRFTSATRELCFIVDLSVLDPLDPRLPANILGDYTLEFQVKVKSTLKDLRECLTESIKDRVCCKEILGATVEDYDKMGRTYEAELTTLKAEESGPFSNRDGVHSTEIPSCKLGE